MALIARLFVEACRPVTWVGDPGVVVSLWEDGVTELTKDDGAGRTGGYVNQVDPALHDYYVKVSEDASPDPYAIRVVEAALGEEPGQVFFDNWNLDDIPYEPDDADKDRNTVYVGNTTDHYLNRYASANDVDWQKVSWEDPPPAGGDPSGPERARRYMRTTP